MRLLFSTLLFAITALTAIATEPVKIPHLAVFYGEVKNVDDFKNFDLLVFESDQHPPVQKFKEQGKVVLAYLSLCEITKHRKYFAEAKGKNLLLGTNPSWKESFFLDIRNPWWSKFIIEELIPNIVHEGYDGIMLDTADSCIELERQNPKKYAGLSVAAIKTISAIRQNYPEIAIMVNRGLGIGKQIAGDINFILAENIMTDCDVKKKKCYVVPEKDYSDMISALDKIKQENQKLEIFTLDYWDFNDKQGISKIYDTQRKNGFIPYVSNIELDKIGPVF